MLRNVLEAVGLTGKSKQQRMEEIYDHFERPPNIFVAKQHAKATKFATPVNIINNSQNSIISRDQNEKCPCCGLPTENQDLPLCTSLTSFGFNGSGVALYFDFLLFSILLLSIYIAVAGIYNLVSDLQGGRCKFENSKEKHLYLCQDDFYNLFSRTNIYEAHPDKHYLTGSTLNFASCIIMMIGSLYYRRHINQMAMDIDDSIVSASDFSVIVRNIPRRTREQEILSYFSQPIRHKQVEVMKISMAYEISDYLKKDKQKIRQQEVLTRVLEDEAKGKQLSAGFTRQSLEDEIKRLSEELDFLEVHRAEKFAFSGVCFISYLTEKQADLVCEQFDASVTDLILEEFGYHNRHKKWGANTLIARKAPEPGDILWGNLGITAWEQLKMKILTNSITALLLFFAFGIIFAVQYGQIVIGETLEEGSYVSIVIMTLLGILASLIITIINQALFHVIDFFGRLEKHSTRTSFDISVASKLGVAQFMNTALLSLILNFVIKQNSENLLVVIWKSGGLNADIMIVFITNSIVPWLLQLLDPAYLYKLYVRQRILSEGSNSKYNQQQANKAFEGPQIELAQKYAQINQTLMFSFFYAYLLPLGLMISCCGLVCTYWAEKYLLLRRDSKPPPTGSTMAEAMIDFYVELIFVVYSAGCCVWEAVIFGQLHPLTWAQLGISFLYFLLPTNDIFWFIVKIGTENATRETYQEACIDFLDDYDRANPITKDEALEKWLKLKGSANVKNQDPLPSSQVFKTPHPIQSVSTRLAVVHPLK